MASPRLLFLLSCLFLSAWSAGSQKGQYDVQRIRSQSQIVLGGIGKIKDMIAPFLGVIETHGTLIAVTTNLALGIILGGQNEVIEILREEFDKVNAKIDEYHDIEQWEIWAAGSYATLEGDIKVAWDDFQKLRESLENMENLEEKADERKVLIDEFVRTYPNAATQKLHLYLTTTGASLMNNLAEALGKRIKCYENQLRAYTFVIDSLLYMGITMNHFIKKVQHTETEQDFEVSANMAYESAAFMFDIYKSCLLNSDYIIEDVKALISDPRRRTRMAHVVRSFLAQKYDRYDWMVVVYKATHSDRPFKVFNQHTLSGFTFEVTVGDVNVALARQTRGTHTLADKVKRAIQRCLYNEVDCHQVAGKLASCNEKLEKVKRDGKEIPVTDAFTAVHAYIDASHAAVNAKQAPDDSVKSNDDTEPYIYTGICKKLKLPSALFNYFGRFVVLIKSDEEILKKDPCSGMNCGGATRGKCVPVKDVFVAMCECTKPFYGENCEKSQQDYINTLKETSIKTS